MHQTIRRSLVVLTAVGILMLSASTAFAKDHAVPFKASFSGAAAFTSPTTTGFWGIGTASHLGRITTTGQAQITCFPPDGTSTACDGGTGCPGGVPNINTETLAAANGDTLTIQSSDVACPTGPYQYHGSGQWMIVGGTGRFAGATGSGSFDGHSDFAAGTFDISLAGTIDD